MWAGRNEHLKISKVSMKGTEETHAQESRRESNICFSLSVKALWNFQLESFVGKEIPESRGQYKVKSRKPHPNANISYGDRDQASKVYTTRKKAAGSRLHRNPGGQGFWGW